jgi:chemotaxis protein methyltransferase CheR
MTPQSFAFVAGLVRRECGLVLTADKSYLIESRLTPVARRWKTASIDEFVASVEKAGTRDMIRDVVEAMVTNESFFFRDKKPFDQFRDILLPQLISSRAAQKHIRIWCAAASTGQEPYTLAMLVKEAEARLKGWRVEILGTDISTEVLARAKLGVYSQFEVQRGLPVQFLVKYFKKMDDKWEIAPALKSMVDYRLFNLMDDPRALGRFDVVFCRNVLIYFDQETKGRILDRISRQMAPDGALYLGGAETVLGLTTRFEPMPNERGIYTLVSTEAAKQRLAV